MLLTCAPTPAKTSCPSRGLHSSDGRVLVRYSRGLWFESRSSQSFLCYFQELFKSSQSVCPWLIWLKFQSTSRIFFSTLKRKSWSMSEWYVSTACCWPCQNAWVSVIMFNACFGLKTWICLNWEFAVLQCQISFISMWDLTWCCCKLPLTALLSLP